ncbi:MATE family efflux transporter [Haloimpatiens sp. FM7315]|uniref:MATE family efflux transporter n=1 Tax=Haloimpatiens sp. FM7315 TaxID=3298609 RepID=UPI00370B83E0
MAAHAKCIADQKKDFSTGKVSKVLLRFAIPAIISLLVAELYNMVDTIFVGIAIGPRAIGALTIAFPVQRLVSSIGLLIAVGASTIVARKLGEGESQRVGSVIVNAIFIMVVIILSLVFIIYVFKGKIIKGLGATENIFPYAKEYISLVILGAIFQCFTILMGYIMISLGNAKINLIATSMGAMCNILVDYLLVIVIPLGVTGAAVATVTSQIISAFYVLYHFLRVKNKLKLSLNFSMNKNIILTILAVGFSTFIVEISDAVVSVVLNNLLVPYGDTPIIILGIISKISMFMYVTIIGISSAMQPIVAFNYGALNYKRVNDTVKVAIKAVGISSIVLWGVMMIFAPYIVGSFVSEKDILLEAVKAFRIVILIFPCIGTYFVTIYYYQAIEEARISLILSIYRQLLIFIPIALILGKYLGMIGIWIAYPISDGISAITAIYYKKKAMEIQSFHDESMAGEEKVNKSYKNRIGSYREA